MRPWPCAAVLLALSALSSAHAEPPHTASWPSRTLRGRRLLEDGEKRGLVTPIVHLLGEVLQTDEIEEKENEELDAINRRSEEGGEDASDYERPSAGTSDEYDVEMVPAEEQERETREGQAAEDAQQLQRAPSPDAAEEQQDEEQEEVELQQELNVVHGDEMALREELRAVKSDLDEDSDAPLAAQAMAEEQSAQTANPFDDGGADVLIGDDHTSLELLLDSDAAEVRQEESVQRVTAQDAFDGSEWTLPPPPPPPPWLYHYADSDGNAILDSDGNAVNAPRPPHNHMMKYAHRSNRVKSPPPPTNPPLLRPPYAPRPPFRLAHSPPYNTGVEDDKNVQDAQKPIDLNHDGQNMDAGSYGVHDGGMTFLARKHHAPELMGMLAMAVAMAMAVGVTVSHTRRRRRAAENEAMSRPIVYGRPTYGAFDNSQKDYVPEEATSLLA